jgi:hypothetical protein
MGFQRRELAIFTLGSFVSKEFCPSALKDSEVSNIIADSIIEGLQDPHVCHLQIGVDCY